MKIQTLKQLEDIQNQYRQEINMRTESEDAIDIQVLGGDNRKYDEIRNFIKKIYDFFDDKSMANVRVLYKNSGFYEEGFDIKIYTKKDKLYINGTDAQHIEEELSEVYESGQFTDKEEV